MSGLYVTRSRFILLTPIIKATWDACQGWPHGLCPRTWEGTLTKLAFHFLHLSMSAQQGSYIPTLALRMEKSWGSVFSPRSQAGSALGMSVPILGLEQDNCVVQRAASLLCYIKTAWDRAHCFIMSRRQCLGKQLTGQQRLVPVLLLSYSTRLLGVSQPSSSALQAAWHQAGLSGGTIFLGHGQHCARTPTLKPKET